LDEGDFTEGHVIASGR